MCVGGVDAAGAGHLVEGAGGGVIGEACGGWRVGCGGEVAGWLWRWWEGLGMVLEE